MYNENEFRPRGGYNRDGAGRDGAKRFDNRREGGERRPHYDRNNGENGERPHYNRTNSFGEGGYRQRNNFGGNRYENRTENGEQRPRFNRYNNGTEGENRPQRPYQNRYNGGENGERPRYNRTNNFGEGGYRQRNNFGGNRYENRTENGEQRPRFNRYNNGTEGENRPQRPYQNRYNGGDRQNRPFRPRTADYDANAKYSRKKQEIFKQQINYDEPMRLNRFLANSGICSRREADEFIAAGVVSVNDQIVTELGTKVTPATDRVMFHDQLVRCEKRVYILMNKPKDCVTTMDDPQARLTVMDLLKNACHERVYPVGRLDRNTTGVLLITNDGDLATKMTHPKYNQKKIYEVVLDRDITEDDMQRLRTGIELEDGEIHTDEISYTTEGVMNKVGVEIHSGRNRIVRRMFAEIGYKVLRLDRVYFAGLTKKNLPRGKWRYLSEMEVNMLKMLN